MASSRVSSKRLSVTDAVGIGVGPVAESILATWTGPKPPSTWIYKWWARRGDDVFISLFLLFLQLQLRARCVCFSVSAAFALRCYRTRLAEGWRAMATWRHRFFFPFFFCLSCAASFSLLDSASSGGRDCRSIERRPLLSFSLYVSISRSVLSQPF